MKVDENFSRPNGAWPGEKKTTSSAAKASRRSRSPAFTASIQIECTVRISCSSDVIACLVTNDMTLRCSPKGIGDTAMQLPLKILVADVAVDVIEQTVRADLQDNPLSARL